MDAQDEIIVEELEEGEVSNESDNDYTPLERPENYSNLKKDPRFPQTLVAQEQYAESEEEQSSELDSDSDSSGIQLRKSKRSKIKLIVKPHIVQNKMKKYDIWSTKVQEDVLSETLNSCDVTKKDRSRDVESYNYVVSTRYQNMLNGGNYKRTRDDRKNIHLRLGTRADDPYQKQIKGKSRCILDLVTTLESTMEEIAKDIANKLYEEKEELILKVLNAIGKQKCFDIFQETKEMEANGGMLIMNQTRRRTPGGVFLYLVRCDDSITREQKDQIFNEEKKIHKKSLKERRKKKIQKLKNQTAEERAKLLPELLTHAECLMENRLLKESDEEDVTNPPPTPETDCHENSCDGIENLTNIRGKINSTGKRDRLTTYDDDLLDISCSNNDMDLF